MVVSVVVCGGGSSDTLIQQCLGDPYSHDNLLRLEKAIGRQLKARVFACVRVCIRLLMCCSRACGDAWWCAW